MFKVNNKDTRTTPGVVLVSLLLTLDIFHTLCVSIVDFEHVIAGCITITRKEHLNFKNWLKNNKNNDANTNSLYNKVTEIKSNND